MQFNHFAAAVLTAGALALLSISPAGAADRKFLADRHVERGVACASCHGTDAPKPGARRSSIRTRTTTTSWGWTARSAIVVTRRA